MNYLRLLIASFETELGFMAIAATNAGVVHRIWFDYADESALRSALHISLGALNTRDELLEFDDAGQRGLVRRFKKFVRGQVDNFADLKIDTSGMTAFQKRVVARARKIPYGKTMSYGELAQKSGSPGAARAVGSVMAKNRFPLLVPCHRVIASGQRLGGFSSSQGLKTKSRLLRMEGAVDEKGALIR